MSGDHEVVNTLENIVVNYNREKSIKNKMLRHFLPSKKR